MRNGHHLYSNEGPVGRSAHALRIMQSVLMTAIEHMHSSKRDQSSEESGITSNLDEALMPRHDSATLSSPLEFPAPYRLT